MGGQQWYRGGGGEFVNGSWALSKIIAQTIFFNLKKYSESFRKVLADILQGSPSPGTLMRDAVSEGIGLRTRLQKKTMLRSDPVLEESLGALLLLFGEAT